MWHLRRLLPLQQWHNKHSASKGIVGKHVEEIDLEGTLKDDLSIHS